MIHLKRAGIALESYNSLPAADHSASDSLTPLLFPYNGDYGYGGETMRTEMAKMQPFGSVLYMHENNTENRTRGDDLYSSAVKTEFRVAGPSAKTAVGILRSCHGYGMRII